MNRLIWTPNSCQSHRSARQLTSTDNSVTVPVSGQSWRRPSWPRSGKCWPGPAPPPPAAPSPRGRRRPAHPGSEDPRTGVESVINKHPEQVRSGPNSDISHPSLLIQLKDHEAASDESYHFCSTSNVLTKSRSLRMKRNMRGCI